MRILETIGKVVGYVFVAILFLAVTAVDLWVLFRYGLFAWLFLIPVAAILLGLLFTLGTAAVAAVGWVVCWLGRSLARLFGGAARSRDDA